MAAAGLGRGHGVGTIHAKAGQIHQLSHELASGRGRRRANSPSVPPSMSGMRVSIFGSPSTYCTMPHSSELRDSANQGPGALGGGHSLYPQGHRGVHCICQARNASLSEPACARECQEGGSRQQGRAQRQVCPWRVRKGSWALDPAARGNRIQARDDNLELRVELHVEFLNASVVWCDGAARHANVDEGRRRLRLRAPDILFPAAGVLVV